MENAISFYLNGKLVVIQDPDIDTLLIDYLRSPEVHLSGPKKPCGQGGCGGCTVIVSNWNSKENKEEHRAINSCLRPLIAVDGMVVTTVEGTGAARRPNPEYLTNSPVSSRSAATAELPLQDSVIEAYDEAQSKRQEVFAAVKKALNRKSSPKLLLQTQTAEHPSEVTHLGMNPVAYQLAMNNGTQCGYCTVGFVMNMSEFIANNPKATKKEIEDIFDGNICRCTGYRPILTGMKTFASDWTAEDEKERMKCLGDDAVQSQLPAASIVIPFPDGAQKLTRGASIQNNSRRWLCPLTLTELIDDLNKLSRQKPFIIHANTAYGIYKQEFLNAKVIIDIRLVTELNAPPVISANGIKIASGTTYSDVITIFEKALKRYSDKIPAGRDPETTPWGAALFMAKRTAGRIVRNAASIGGNAMLVFKHITEGVGDPFPSDPLTGLTAAGTLIEYINPTVSAEINSISVEALAASIVKQPEFAERILLVSFYIPFGSPNDV